MHRCIRSIAVLLFIISNILAINLLESSTPHKQLQLRCNSSISDQNSMILNYCATISIIDEDTVMRYLNTDSEKKLKISSKDISSSFFLPKIPGIQENTEILVDFLFEINFSGSQNCNFSYKNSTLFLNCSSKNNSENICFMNFLLREKSSKLFKTLYSPHLSLHCQESKFQPEQASHQIIKKESRVSICTHERHDPDCEPCPAGHFCLSHIISPCPAGSFSPEGASDCYLCPWGYFTNETGSEKCLKCSNSIPEPLQSQMTCYPGVTAPHFCPENSFVDRNGMCLRCETNSIFSKKLQRCVPLNSSLFDFMKIMTPILALITLLTFNFSGNLIGKKHETRSELRKKRFVKKLSQ